MPFALQKLLNFRRFYLLIAALTVCATDVIFKIYSEALGQATWDQPERGTIITMNKGVKAMMVIATWELTDSGMTEGEPA